MSTVNPGDSISDELASFLASIRDSKEDTEDLQRRKNVQAKFTKSMCEHVDQHQEKAIAEKVEKAAEKARAAARAAEKAKAAPKTRPDQDFCRNVLTQLSNTQYVNVDFAKSLFARNGLSDMKGHCPLMNEQDQLFVLHDGKGEKIKLPLLYKALPAINIGDVAIPKSAQKKIQSMLGFNNKPRSSLFDFLDAVTKAYGAENPFTRTTSIKAYGAENPFTRTTSIKVMGITTPVPVQEGKLFYSVQLKNTGRFYLQLSFTTTAQKIGYTIQRGRVFSVCSRDKEGKLQNWNNTLMEGEAREMILHSDMLEHIRDKNMLAMLFVPCKKEVEEMQMSGISFTTWCSLSTTQQKTLAKISPNTPENQHWDRLAKENKPYRLYAWAQKDEAARDTLITKAAFKLQDKNSSKSFNQSFYSSPTWEAMRNMPTDPPTLLSIWMDLPEKRRMKLGTLLSDEEKSAWNQLHDITQFKWAMLSQSEQQQRIDFVKNLANGKDCTQVLGKCQSTSLFVFIGGVCNQ